MGWRVALGCLAEGVVDATTGDVSRYADCGHAESVETRVWRALESSSSVIVIIAAASVLFWYLSIFDDVRSRPTSLMTCQHSVDVTQAISMVPVMGHLLIRIVRMPNKSRLFLSSGSWGLSEYVIAVHVRV